MFILGLLVKNLLHFTNVNLLCGVSNRQYRGQANLRGYMLNGCKHFSDFQYTSCQNVACGRDNRLHFTGSLPFSQLLNFIKRWLKCINYFLDIPVIAIALPQGGYMIGRRRGGDLFRWENRKGSVHQSVLLRCDPR